VQGGDAGSVVNQAILTKGNPQGDVLFGVDNTLLTKALKAGIFETHTPAAESTVPNGLQLDPSHHVAPVDYGDVCLNYDKQWFATHGVAVPSSLEDLVKPAYKGLLVVENAATSSPGLAFLLATIDHFGTKGWEAWWSQLRANGVHVVDGWEQAYEGDFSGGGESKGTKPLVVSYASSPPVEVVYGGSKVKDSNVGVIEEGCYRQIEGAGILAGTKHPKEAAKLVDFMESARFQADMPLQMFVYPVVPGVPLPEVFTRYAITPTHVAALPPAEVDAHREAWVKRWLDLVVN
jgi:thiamine transport system substrate-binding protein